MTNLTPEPVPETLDYDFWLGPAPYKPYHPHRVHATFRGYWDYDGGGLGDMGQHYLDPVQYFLGKDDTSPVEVEVDAPQQHPDAVSSWRRIVLRCDGCEIILTARAIDTSKPYIEGPDGKLFGVPSDILNLEKKLAQFPTPNRDDGLRRGGPYADQIASTNPMAIALHDRQHCQDRRATGRNLRFDPVKQEFIDDAGANRLVYQPMRALAVVVTASC